MPANLREFPVQIPCAGLLLGGTITLPQNPHGIVLFAHGSGSSRLSPRNRFVASVLHDQGIGTLLFDLLTEEEDQVYEHRFDIELLTERLLTATQWIETYKETKKLLIGYFGASTGAAAALKAAATLGKKVSAVVSRGGRPDLASREELRRVLSPTLLIVGGNDTEVIVLNTAAYDEMTATKKMMLVPGATHVFEEPGTLEEVARLATAWFLKYLKENAPSSHPH